MINYFLGPAAVAFYSIPSKLNRLIRVLPFSIKQVFLPQLHQAKDSKSIKSIVAKLNIILLATGIPMALGIYFFSKPLLAKFFSAEYQEAIELAPWFAFIAIVWFLNVSPDMLLASKGDHKGRNWIQFASIVMNIGLNWFLIPRFGVVGGIVATIVANFSKFVLMQLRYSISFDK
jgi:O-antigen/teichoic acid export membrane protein